MSSDWKILQASQVCGKHKSAMSTGPFGSAISSRYFVDSGVPVIRGSNLSQDVDTRLNHADLVFITEEKAREFERSTVKHGDLVFTCWGTIDQVGLIDERSHFEEYVISNKQMKMTPDPAVTDSTFLYYQFSSPKIKRWIIDNGIGSSVPGFNLGMLKSIELNIPPLSEQKAIAHILGTLDDKIELNRKTNETLEAMAKALFKSWFVDFDPVRATAEGRPTGLPSEISDLFPDSFEDSELSEIPRGWRCSPLTERVIYLSRGISPAYCEEGGVLVLNQKCIRDSRVYFEKARRHDTTRKQIIGRDVRRFDALVNSTGVGTLGRVAMMPTYQEEVVVDSHVTVVRGSNDQESFFISSTLLNRQVEIEALGEGSTGQTELSRVVLGSLPVIFPSSQLISAYFDSAYAIQDKIEKNEEASVALASTRDTLLPKLISGEIRIPDAEKLLESVL